MGFFTKKDKLAIPLPPNELARSQPSSSSSSSAAGNAQNSTAARNELFGTPSGGPPAGRAPSVAPSYASEDPYGARPRQHQRPDVDVQRLAQESDPTRAALFSGYNPAALPKTDERRQYSSDPYATGGGGEGGEGGTGGTEQDEEEEVELIKRDIRGVKQESLGATRNALRIAREAEETARGTLGKLGDQSGASSLRSFARGLRGGAVPSHAQHPADTLPLACPPLARGRAHRQHRAPPRPVQGGELARRRQDERAQAPEPIDAQARLCLEQGRPFACLSCFSPLVRSLLLTHMHTSAPRRPQERKRMEEERRITDRHIDETSQRAKAKLDVQQTQQVRRLAQPLPLANLLDR